MIVTLWLVVCKANRRVTYTRTIETGWLPAPKDFNDGIWAWGSPYGEPGPYITARRRYMDQFGMWHIELYRLVVEASAEVEPGDTVWIGDNPEININEKLYTTGWKKYVK